MSVNDGVITKEFLLEILLNALPYSNQMSDIRFHGDSEKTKWIAFEWRGIKLQVSTEMKVRNLQGQLQRSDQLTLLLEALLNRTFQQMVAEHNARKPATVSA